MLCDITLGTLAALLTSWQRYGHWKRKEGGRDSEGQGGREGGREGREGGMRSGMSKCSNQRERPADRQTNIHKHIHVDQDRQTHRQMDSCTHRQRDRRKNIISYHIKRGRDRVG